MTKLFDKVKSWFASEPEVKEEAIEKAFNTLMTDVVFCVDTFNTWFCDPNNGATYANKGIFLRTDKLSMSHIEEYLEKRHQIEPEMQTDLQPEMYNFYTQIRNDWVKKINHN